MLLLREVRSFGLPRRSAGMGLDPVESQFMEGCIVVPARGESRRSWSASRDVDELILQIRVAQAVTQSQCPFVANQLVEIDRQRRLFVFQSLPRARREDIRRRIYNVS